VNFYLLLLSSTVDWEINPKVGREERREFSDISKQTISGTSLQKTSVAVYKHSVGIFHEETSYLLSKSQFSLPAGSRLETESEAYVEN
jgi:hypothetical protein